ncbi:2OG-Fe(II) oxygenase [Halioxenophilus sp. WMMB6]|uniref:2OG-Fe(II) oxygenase n=1 Tax=Halioxenophilus sp. WMMB6 TaxID=3073815 RepID=UPI00295E6FFA|nr:2OG-Fe(II) oxygenase [Halioxenophilus sp. WMMB6]
MNAQTGAIAPSQHSYVDASGLTTTEALVMRAPFSFLVAPNMLDESDKQTLIDDFPLNKSAGYLPYNRESCATTINELIDQIAAPGFANPLGEQLGIDNLAQYPTYVSIATKLNKRHGTIHTDGKSKVATLLLYLNEEWSGEGKGCLRFLNKIDDIEDTVVPEIQPKFGTLVAFKRADNSFHGHLPFEGERRVIQIAWLVSDEDAKRKAKRGKLSQKIKNLFNRMDKKVGSQRDDNAYH